MRPLFRTASAAIARSFFDGNSGADASRMNFWTCRIRLGVLQEVLPLQREVRKEKPEHLPPVQHGPRGAVRVQLLQPRAQRGIGETRAARPSGARRARGR